jgi:PST family polysaccharide transporter
MTELVEPLDAQPSGRRLAFGAGALGIVGILKLCVQAASLPVMARLLGPSEIGLYALALPVVAFVTMLADGGLGISLAGEPETSNVWSTAFWVLLFTGILLSCVLTGIGFAEGSILHQPRVPGLMAALSVTVVLMTVSVPSLARLDRQGRIAVGAFADLAGNLMGVSIGVTMAFRGAGAWSLVAQYLTLFVVRAVIVNVVAFVKPQFEFHPRLMLRHISTGGLVVGTRIADYFGRMVENLVLGHTLGTAPLGRYSFSTQISRYLSEMISNPLWLTLYIRALRATPGEAVSLHCQLSRLLGFLVFPIAVFTVVAAPMVVTVCLGPKWVAAIPLLQILVPSYALGVVASLSGALLLAGGQYQIQFYAQVGLSAARALAVCLGPWVGLIGIAYGITVTTTAYALIMLIAPATITGCHPLPVLRNLAGPFVASLALGLFCRLLLHHAAPSLVRLGVAVLLGTFVYLAVNFLVDRKRLLQDFTLATHMLFHKS